MHTIFLSGGGIQGRTPMIDSLFRQHTDGQANILYLGAAKQRAGTFGAYWVRLQTIFGVDFDMWVDVSRKTNEDLSKYSAVYIGGGNTFDLLHHLRETGFDEALTAFIQSGGAVYGESAGAIVLGQTIKTSALLDLNECGITDLRGLDVLGGYSVACHYQPAHQPFLEGVAKDDQTTIIALQDGEGLSAACGFVDPAQTTVFRAP